MSSNGVNADKAEAAERRKRKAEQLADDPRFQKVQKQVKIKQEPPDPSREIADSVSESVDGQAQQSAANEAGHGDNGDSDDETSDDSESGDGSESSSSSDNDAESSSESEDEEEEEEQQPEKGAQSAAEHVQPSQPAARLNPVGTESRPSNTNTTPLSDRNDELARLRASSCEQLQDRNVEDGRATEILKEILKVLWSMIEASFEDVTGDPDALQATADTVSGTRHREKHRTNRFERRHEVLMQRSPMRHPPPASNTRERSSSKQPSQRAVPLHSHRKPDFPFEIDNSESPSIGIAAPNNNHVPQPGRPVSNEPSQQKGKKRRGGKKGENNKNSRPANNKFQLFARHVEEAVRRSPDIPSEKIWTRSHCVWNQLLDAERRQWDDLFTRYKAECEDHSSTTEPANRLIEEHDVLDRLRRLDVSSRTPPPRHKTPGPRSCGHKHKQPKGSMSNGAGSSRGRSVESYRPAR
ncbi:hypothetical protein M409DRAFT_29537 [Zasmidium cellare ATCC 36951]|uniref:Uncharacterized protein n=1 Tax=Zasmidium cellare ATCC 36951 TaxID=1080233 RepID=A0A6A6C0Y6_ZASCE|nr:uncharacterized protein M409DRAFT_29537 [Zasmidium cellare ATCC 36951]KAF2159928.1 hypothetical protein M409DRAFT_29537 [Zasmidium cellare ATCC 36951]